MSTKVQKAFNSGDDLYFEHPNGILCIAHELEPDDHYPDVQYMITYHRGLMPAYNRTYFDSLAQLVMTMRAISKDMRKWRILHQA